MLLFSCTCSDKSVRVYKWQVGDTFSEVGYSPLLGHTYGVNCVTFSPFGTKLASASTDGSTVIWDVKVRYNLVFPLFMIVLNPNSCMAMLYAELWVILRRIWPPSINLGSWAVPSFVYLTLCFLSLLSMTFLAAVS